ncbi:MAG: Bug family tripartite tricarboxylate transporter substrate binding protein [Curvibacter lanceolatus]|jgi:tripartite-type tricarboxylate transporter receptor subunit TctC|uniref:Bug family tripartite tricarboxylate transporter substrate binding protein n=1 Tax=Curvibacter lanceolatus TaxID=86182 RepID=UPI002357D0F1|nr:Bug family tripartite tricarboxylate transporter substrate binding protein [Curvibacter lanceolatus]MBV5296538.1 Bug family tripartite tricarboxylate transporter substrate binding protein [Curvibacter lanceolatus]
MKRYHFLLGALALALTSATGTALAQNNASIRILVGFAAGGSSDMIARQLAQGLQQELGQPVVVDNKPGAGGQIAAQLLKAAKPDGLTLYLSNSHTMAMIPLTVLNPGYDAAKDFAPIGLVAVNPDVFVINPSVVGNPKAGLKEFAQWAKGNPDRGNVGVPAPASAPDFAVGIVAKALDADLRSVPYRGDAPVAQDVMAGQISAGIGSVGAMLQPAKAGKVRIVAVNGTSRLALLPDVPTYAELGIKGYEEMIYTGLFAPAGLPADLVQRYSTALAKVVKSEAFTEKLSAMGISAASSSPAELAARVAHTHKDWTVMVKNAGYKPQ